MFQVLYVALAVRKCPYQVKPGLDLLPSLFRPAHEVTERFLREILQVTDTISKTKLLISHGCFKAHDNKTRQTKQRYAVQTGTVACLLIAPAGSLDCRALDPNQQ